MVEAICESSCVEWGEMQQEFSEEVTQVLKSVDVAEKLFQELIRLGLMGYEKKLGHGAHGWVYQVDGGKLFPKWKVALKFFSFSNLNTISSHGFEGEALSLKLPEGGHLGKVHGLLTYDGQKVHFVEKYDPKIHGNQVLLGTISQAIQGVSLFEKIKERVFSIEEVKGYGRTLAKAILDLHEAGLAHKDIHVENVFVNNCAPDMSTYDITIIDFGNANVTSDKRVRHDWKGFGYIMSEMGGDELIFDPDYYDLMYSEKHGLLNGLQPYSEEEVLNHPFFSL